MERMRSVYNVLTGKPERKIPLRSLRPTWKDNIKMVLKETAWEDVDWFHLTWDWDQWQVHVNSVMESINTENFLSSY
jgi:hypothetical protein